MFKPSLGVVASSIVLFALVGCGQSNEQAREEGKGTDFPGQVTAEGLTSGEIMAKNGTLQAKKDPMASPVYVDPKAASGSPAPAQNAPPTPQQPQGGGNAGAAQVKTEGTPGIPGGSEGTVSGTQMGGTSPAAAATEDSAKPASAADTKASKEAEAKAKAEQEKKQLEAAMDRVAKRWQETAAARGWQMESAGNSADTSGISSMGQTETSAIGLPTIIRSEKLGTAPPSEDVKNPAKKPAQIPSDKASNQ